MRRLLAGDLPVVEAEAPVVVGEHVGVGRGGVHREAERLRCRPDLRVEWRSVDAVQGTAAVAS